MKTPAQRPAQKKSLAIFAGLVLFAGVGLAIAFQRPPCSGWRDCYLVLHRVESGQGEADQYRQVLLDHFAASSDKIAFSVLMPDNHSVGLLIADRRSGTSRIMSEPGAYFGQPYFSADGRRFLLVRARQGRPYRQLLSCQIATWQCEIVVQMHDSIMFPIELDANTIVYASSAMRTLPDGGQRYDRYDLYAVRKGREPKRLTEFGLYELGWLTVGAGKIVFGASGSNPHVLPPWRPTQTEIYSIKFDQQNLEITQPALPLSPVFQMDTVSMRPAMSPDGERLAFLNVETVHGKYHYNMAVATLDGKIEHYIKVEGLALSHGAFVGDTLLVNELFKDHNRVRRLDLRRGTVDDILTLDYSAAAIAKLDPIKLQVNDGEQSAGRISPIAPN
jgi:hypothetical protein